MLPIFPQSHAPAPPPEVPRAPTPVTALLILYCVAGAICGAADGGIAGAVNCAVNRWTQPGSAPAGFGVANSFVIALPPPDPVTEVIAGAGAGLCPGFVGGLFLWFIVSMWPAARHPVRAASLCASLGGTYCLVMAVLQIDEIHARIVFGIGAVVVLGAIFGFLTSWLARLMERMLEKFVHGDRADGVS